MTEDPYRLAKDIRGIGFKTADAIAMKLGLTPEAPQRLRAGISFALQTATDGGHCALPVAELIKLAGELLGVDAALIRSALLDVLETGEVVQDILGHKACIFLAGLHAAERMIAARLPRRMKRAPPWPELDLAAALTPVQDTYGQTPPHSQRASRRQARRRTRA
ncbi:ATP-dependent RecD-like DNA helicase, partial [Methylobacterium sp. J-001]|uniref:helix-hairpin-helix domain-containing protein n=1 Tax=Methylobacterium sp. J-001 TaxID=2836609 RepID=UPI002443C3F5